ncbi:glyoxalase superfamily protein [uncultured Cytophaga sp.]|uniref:glyoxalase superfamily protein n=1 Tax=uncultured Cytophaga sp. TaxID=160238 RepID=UPI00262089FE|nr:glyoxalase superfamily protein [uncultured Cytophaga sp.]
MKHFAIPVIRIFDYQKAFDFYINWLEFNIDWEHVDAPGMPRYIQISSDSVKIHLTEHHGDCSPGAKVFIEFSFLKEFHAELVDKNYLFYKPTIEHTLWNALTMEVTDPFGNKLVFNESL